MADKYPQGEHLPELSDVKTRTLSIKNCTHCPFRKGPTDGGVYWCLVSYGGVSITSAVDSLTVYKNCPMRSGTLSIVLDYSE